MQAITTDIRKGIHKKKEGLEVINSRPSLTTFVVDKTFLFSALFIKTI